MQWLFFFAVILTRVAAGQTDAVRASEAQLAQQLVSHQVRLRAPYAGRIIDFAADGECTSGCEIGSWATDSTILIRKVELTQDSLSLAGDRLCVYSDETGTPRAFVSAYPAKVTIALGGTATPAAISHALA